MFESLKRAHRFSRMGALWIRVTGLDLRDRGQIARVASASMVNDLQAPEEAWLSALVAWTTGMPWAEDKRCLAQCIVVFALDPRVTQSVPIEPLDNARFAALGLLDDLMQEDMNAYW
jgi:hypothetical protein